MVSVAAELSSVEAAVKGALAAADAAAGGPAPAPEGPPPPPRVEVEGLEGNASIISGGGPVKAHLQERFGSVFIDSSGGDVNIAIAPGTEGSLQLQARGGIAVDPALKVTGELTSTSLIGTLGGADPALLGRTQQQPAWGSHRTTTTSSGSSSGSSSSSSFRGGGVRPVSAEEIVLGPSHTTYASDDPAVQDLPPRAASASANASRLWRSQAAPAAPAAAGSSSRGNDVAAEQEALLVNLQGSPGKLIVNAGAGRVVLVAKGWMDGLREKMKMMQQEER